MKAILMNGFRWDAEGFKRSNVDREVLRSRVWDMEVLKVVLLFVALVVAWPLLQRLVLSMDVTAGYVDPGILVLVVLAVLCFLGMVGLSWWLLRRFLVVTGLPGFGTLVLRFKDLMLWQQFGFYWLCYALLLLAGVGCLIAVL